MAPFGPVLDMVAKLNSTKSFCWLKEKIVITTAQVRGAHRHLRYLECPILNFTSSQLSPQPWKPSEQAYLGRRVVQIEALSSQPCANLLSTSFLTSRKFTTQTTYGRHVLNNFFFVTYLLKGIFRSLVDVRMYGSISQYKRCSLSTREGNLTFISAPLW